MPPRAILHGRRPLAGRGRGVGSGPSRLARLLLALAASTTGVVAHADPAPPPDGAPATDEEPYAAAETASDGGTEETALAAAKQLFLQGNALRTAGDLERALEYYLRSRALVSSAPNTINAAYCLDKLGRHDEALELYEELLTELRDRLAPDELAAVAEEMGRLRGLVGSVDVIGNVAGSLVIDGRPRGQLPLVAPVRVLPGKHVVLVLAQGYRSFETTVDVAVGRSLRVRARLEPLASAGKLRVDDPALVGAQLFVDGAAIGTVPWEGSLAPGSHYFFVRRGAEGSAPKPVVVVRGQTVRARTGLRRLGPELRITVAPATAELTIGGVEVGRGRWQGRLPLGQHDLRAREEGYRDLVRRLEIAAEMKGAVELRLEVDAAHPRWGVAPTGLLFLELLGGFAMAPGLGTGAEASCDALDDVGTTVCAASEAAVGFLAGGRAGYEFPLGVALELAGGYLDVRKRVARAHTTTFSVDDVRSLTYDLADELRVSGPFAVGGVGYRLPFARIMDLRAHLAVGALFTSARDDLAVTLSAGGQTVPGRLVGTGGEGRATSASLLVLPELELGLRAGGLRVGLGTTVVISALAGPSYPFGPVQPADPSVCPAAPAAVSCAMGRDLVGGERAYGPFVLIVPRIAVGYFF